MATLFDVIYRTLSILRGERNGVATGGSATTLVDTSQTEANDYLNGGTIFLFSGNNVNKSAVITDWALSTTTFTFPTLTLLCAANDQYAAFDNRYPRASIVQAINRGLGTIGSYQAVNETITTTEDTERYRLPLNVSDVRRVQVASSTNSPYEWSDAMHDWNERDGYLYFVDYWTVPTNMKLRLTYGATVARLSLDGATIPDGFPAERLAAEAAWWAAWARSGYGGSADPETQQDLQNATIYRQEARARFPVRIMPRDSKYTVLP